MKQFFKNIILIPMAIFTLLLSMGMHVTKIQCAKGERMFVGTDISICKMQEKTTSCSMKKKLVKSCINSEKEEKPQKESQDKIRTQKGPQKILRRIAFVFRAKVGCI